MAEQDKLLFGNIKRSSFFPVEDRYGVTVNYFLDREKTLRTVINCVEQHAPVNLRTSQGTVKGNTLSRISEQNFPDVASAKAFVKTYHR